VSKCGECTLCCELLKVPSLDKNAGVLCSNCVLTKGCKIYNSRPQECVDFKCAYIQMDKVHVDLRPDNCKVIFEKISDIVFFGTQDPRFDMTDIAKNQIIQFNKQGFSVIITTSGRSKFYLAKEHTHDETKNELFQFLERKNGRS